MWIVRLTEQRAAYGPIEDRAVADRFAVFLTVEVDPALVELLDEQAAEPLLDPVTELLNWRDAMHTSGRLRTRPSVRGGDPIGPEAELGYRREQEDRD
ncbi:hypothetical protein [Nonomuraea rhizosphaerae]|uniref:hypothetical protein n=1 Tax=Nonomuraea rhizosphaerae TaxID=2665663 RepID=UPI001C5E0D4F|nr:hypothetical protein [Nonomuraea rhizosphaerae]